jgi:hypothetical protein
MIDKDDADYVLQVDAVMRELGIPRDMAERIVARRYGVDGDVFDGDGQPLQLPKPRTEWLPKSNGAKDGQTPTP